MKLDRITSIPYSQRVGRYHFQMIQAKLNGPVEPVFGYNLQPYYTRHQQWISELSDSLSRLYRYSADLDKVARELDSDRNDSVIHNYAATSSNPEAATATARPGAKKATHQLTINNLATAQTNAGRLAEGDSPTSVSAGHQQFSITVGNQEELLSYYSQASDTYLQSLERMAAALNHNELGIFARIGQQDSRVQLLISGVRTGEKQAFSIRDRSGNSVQALGADQRQTRALDAVYVLNGMQQFSPANRIFADNGNVRIDLHQASTEPITITVAPDTERLLEHTRLLISRYNRLQMFLTDREGTLSTQKLDTFERVARAADGVLNQFGIKLLSNGQLEMDDRKWLEAVQSRYNDFAEAMKGITRQFRVEAVRVQSMPTGTFTRSQEDAGHANPYMTSSLASLQFQHAVKTGLYLNLLW